MDSTLHSIPISDLKGDFAQIADMCEKEPIVLTKDGKSIMFVMSYDIFQEKQAELERLNKEIDKLEKELEGLEILCGVGLPESEKDDIHDEFLELIKKEMMDAKNV